MLALERQVFFDITLLQFHFLGILEGPSPSQEELPGVRLSPSQEELPGVRLSPPQEEMPDVRLSQSQPLLELTPL